MFVSFRAFGCDLAAILQPSARCQLSCRSLRSFIAGRTTNAFRQHPELEYLGHVNGLGYRHAAIDYPKLLTVIRLEDNQNPSFATV